MSQQRFEQRGLYFDELVLGASYIHKPGRTLSEADNIAFTTMTMNNQGLHLDAAWAASQPFGKPLINSLLTLSTMIGQSVAQLTEGTIIGQLGINDVRFPHPMFHGDTLYTETEITELRLSKSRPGQGLASMTHTGRNQHGEIVATATRTCLMWTQQAHQESLKAESDD